MGTSGAPYRMKSCFSLATSLTNLCACHSSSLIVLNLSLYPEKLVIILDLGSVRITVEGCWKNKTATLRNLSALISGLSTVKWVMF